MESPAGSEITVHDRKTNSVRVNLNRIESKPPRWRGATAPPVAIAATGCSGPLSTLDPAGPAADAIAILWWIMLAGSVAILLLVLGLIALAFRHGFRRSERPTSARLWLIGGGIVFPVTVLTALLVAGLVLGERTIPAAAGASVTVTAEASRYRWRFAYPGTAATATEDVLHIPAGRPVIVEIGTRDVIHSFWVPQLGGKMDAIPGHVNRLRIETFAPGTHAGVCAEYCGVGHAGHVFRVVAHAPAQWARFARGGRL